MTTADAGPPSAGPPSAGHAATTSRRPWRLPMSARDTHEEERASTPLELLFDLCFVVAVAQAATELHHALAEDHLRTALIGYGTMFFAIWWAWMNFTWFASAYDNDDVPYRLAVFVQIAGVLILAAGIPDAFNDGDFTIVVIGYVVMRVALTSMWIRAGLSDPEHRRTDLRYAAGVATVQLGWIAFLWVPDGAQLATFVVLAALELAVPVWAERTGATTWHARHLAERYGLFTIIVLGESILSATIAVQSSLQAGDALDELLFVAGAGLVIVCSMWWLYFSHPADVVIGHAREQSVDRVAAESFIWGYGHYFVFASVAAVGAGIAVVIDQVSHHAELSSRGATLTVAVPVAVYLVSIWVLHRSLLTGLVTYAKPAGAAIILAMAALGGSVVAIAVVLAVVVAVTVANDQRQTTWVIETDASTT